MAPSKNNLIEKFFQTEENGTLALLRIALGIVMFAHGAQKLFGWFGGYGYSGTMGFMTSDLGIPSFFAFLAIIAESIGALFLIGGFLSRISAFGIGTVMVVAVFAVHLKNGFFMNNGGFEFHILAIAIALTLMIKGGGAFSLDSIITKRIEKNEDNYELSHARS